MNVKFLFNFNKRRILLFFGILVFFIALFFLAAHVVSEQINQHHEKIVNKVKEQFGFPITFDNIKTSWFGLSFGISVQNVTIYDPSVPVAFIVINNIKIYPVLSSILFENEPQFKKLVLQEPKLVIGWDKKDGFSILGLKGEHIPTIVEYSELMKLLSKQKSILIEDAEINWQAPNLSIRQWWSGEFNWVKSKDAEWLLSGEQKLQIREGVISPSLDFSLSVSPNLSAVNLTINSNKFNSQCSFMPKEGESCQIACEANIQNLDIEDIHQIYKSEITDYPLLKWLEGSLVSGKIKRAAVKIGGSLDTLQEEAEFAFKDVNFQYAPGWPAIEEGSGFINFAKNKATIQLQKGKILGTEIETAFALIEPLNKNPIVHVQGFVSSTLEAGLLFLQKSPLQHTFVSYLAALDPKGLMDLNLHLTIPIEDKMPVRVQGDVLAKEAEIKAPGAEISLNQLTGNFHFTENGVESSNAGGYLNEKPLSIKVNTFTTATSKHQTLEVSATGLFNTVFLQEQLQLPILEKLNGESLFTVTFRKPFTTAGNLSETEWIITSDLQGIAIRLPDFLGKTSTQSRPITLKIGIDPKQDKKVSLQVKDIVDAKVFLQNNKGEDELKKGHIVFGGGHADWTPREVLLVGGEIENFKLMDWIDYLNTTESNQQKWFSKLNINVLVNRLEVYELYFGKIWVTANFATAPSIWEVDGPLIKGSLSFPTLNQNNRDNIDIELEYLKIMTNNISKKTAANFLMKKTQFPFAFRCKDFYYENGKFGEVSFKLSPRPYGYAIEDLIFETEISELSGSGEWRLEGNQPYTTLEGKMMGVNIEKTFSEWGYPSAIRESSGYINYQFKWLGHPFQFDMRIIEGNMALKFDKGRIMGVSPGLGRIMGLLNLASIRRRLQLDFSDLLKQGFVFDSMYGDFNFQKGIVSTEALFIDGPAAKIELAGNANLKNKMVDLNMVVMPHVSVGLPIAAALAAGPAVGAGVWILDKITGSKINKLTQHKYRVTNTWDSPVINELGESTRRKK